MTSRSAKRRDANRQREQQNASRVSAEDRAWARWSDRVNQSVHRSAARTTPSDAELMAQANERVDSAVLASLRNDEEGLLLAIEALVSTHLSSGVRAGTVAVENRLASTIRERFAEGWQPLDLAHIANKLLEADHHQLLLAALQLERATTTATHIDDRWRRQLNLLDIVDGVQGQTPQALFARPAGESLVAEIHLVTQVRVAIELALHLRLLAKIPTLMPPPSDKPLPAQSASSATTTLDEKVLGKVRGLLAKAESTTFDEEADALTSKAQELMARHAIDLAMLDASAVGATHASGATARRVHIVDPYFDAKSVLLHVVARANHCTTVTLGQLGMVTVFGFGADLDIVELLFTSLLTQATSAMIAAGAAVDRNGTSRTKSFRRAFLLSFASRIGERLREATQAATDDATSTIGDSLLPVLAGRKDQVAARQKDMFPNTRATRSSSISNADGWFAGREAADRAALQANVPIARRS